MQARFRRQKRRDTAPELALRRLLHRRGLRYLVDARPLPELRRRADLVFPAARIAVFVDGCFWHRCPEHGTEPRHNAEWWKDKLARNVTRDRETDRSLLDAGWLPLRFWEHQPSADAADVVAAAWAARRPGRCSGGQRRSQASSRVTVSKTAPAVDGPEALT
ncbi:DNA mismatch endonuclease Vsr [Vallicoccus soli]|uniref:DNA mismatch endonuclease Vsr n=1 Tax=Vallicoccus soli TaxID=2339232 RepID=A0A3A3ZC80_9ACTN|nr:DNA mismatch endonuclease Vsr [Vallicoccus soli]RJK92518.1 DNA mismatch endonuclease Vsr [Vallicoccus soli]